MQAQQSAIRGRGTHSFPHPRLRPPVPLCKCVARLKRKADRTRLPCRSAYGTTAHTTRHKAQGTPRQHEPHAAHCFQRRWGPHTRPPAPHLMQMRLDLHILEPFLEKGDEGARRYSGLCDAGLRNEALMGEREGGVHKACAQPRQSTRLARIRLNVQRCPLRPTPMATTRV